MAKQRQRCVSRLMVDENDFEDLRAAGNGFVHGLVES